MAAGDIWALRWVWTNATTAEEMTSAFHAEEGATPPDIVDVGDLMKAWWTTASGTGAAYKLWSPNDHSLARVTLRKVVPLSPLEESYTTGLPDAGSSTLDAPAAQLAVLASLRTDNIGRSFRGRLFLPAPSEGFITATGGLAAADAEDVRDQLGELFGDLGAATTLSPGVLSRFTNGALRPTPIITPITNIKVDRILRSQRRRADNQAVYV